MGAGPITFNYAMWVTRYPEFQNISEPLAQLYFNEACIYVDNTGQGPINDPNTLTIILNMATAHICFMNAPKIGDQFNSDGSESSPLVGRISNASEGSVSVGTEYSDQPGTAQWWVQSRYGAAVYQALMPFRTARYLPSLRRRTFNPPFGYRFFGS
jgi:hypothetical protein